jgi:enoyl-CoA hydratase
LLERLLGPSQARHLLLTGNTLDAETVRNIGLVDEVVAPEDLDGRVEQFAHELAMRPPTLVRADSTLLDRAFIAAFRAHLEFELELFVQAYQLPAAREGQQAFFFEKCEPRWLGERQTGLARAIERQILVARMIEMIQP